MERNDRKINSRNHTITIDRDSKYILRKIILDFAILFCGELQNLNLLFIFSVNVYYVAI